MVNSDIIMPYFGQFVKVIVKYTFRLLYKKPLYYKGFCGFGAKKTPPF